MMMDVPTCLWNPQSLQLQQQQIQPWRRSARWNERPGHPNQFQERDDTDMVDSLRMNLRQAKQALTVRDEETRRLRSAVAHLEGALSLRERELRDTVQCLRGEHPARPNQEWLQEGTSSSRLRLQVHRLQRAVVAKQDHIEHLNRQASLGFLRETREQAEEYRLEARRLSQALAAATGGLERPGRFSAGFARPRSSAADGAGDVATGGGEQEERPRGRVVPSRAVTIADGLFPRETPSPLQLVGCSNEGCTDKGVTETRRHASNDNTGCSFAKRECGEEGRRLQPPLEWESNMGATVPPSPSGGRGAMRQRYEPRNAQLVPRLSNVLDALGSGLMALQPPADVTRAAAVHDSSAQRARRASSPKPATGRGSAQVEHRGNRSPDRSQALRDSKRLTCMAASARLRSSVRRREAEKNEVLALREESRRLQLARTERARRARLARQRIARYREERIRELEGRLARRCGETVPDTGSTTEKVIPEESSRDDGNNGSGSVGDGGHFEVGAGKNATADIGADNHSKLELLSRQRREIDAAIAAALEESYRCAGGEPLSGDRSDVENEPPDSARRSRSEILDDKSHHRQRKRRQRQSSGADGLRKAEEAFMHGRDDAPLQLPIGKPPLAPARSGGRPGHHSGVHRRSSVSEIEEVRGGSIAENRGWGNGDCSGSSSTVDEVRTEASIDVDSDESVGNVSDVEGSVWEESFLSKSWDVKEDRNASEEGAPSGLKEVGNVVVRGAANHQGPHRRQRHRVRSETQATEQIGVMDSTKGERRVSPPATRIVAKEGREGGRHSGSGRVSTGKRRPLPEHGDLTPSSTMDFLDISSDEASVGTSFGTRSRELSRNSRRHSGRITDGRGQSNVLAGVMDSSAGVGADETRRRHRRREDDRSGGAVDEGYEEDTEETKHNRRGSLESPGALRGGGEKVVDNSLGTSGVVREETSVFVDEVDDGGSYESRWSLSAEDEPPEANVVENGAHARRVYGEDKGRHEDGFEERVVSPDRKGQEKSQGGHSSILSGIAEGIVNDDVGTVPEYLDDFAEASETRGEGNDVCFGVASPSNDGSEPSAAAEETPGNQEPPDARSFIDGSQREQDLSHADDNTASNDWLINEPPKKARSTVAPLGGVRGPRRPRRPQSAGVERNAEQVLLQPVLPSASRNSSDYAAKGTAGPVAQGIQMERGDRERPQDSQTSAAIQGRETKLDGRSGEIDLAHANSAEQPPSLLGYDARHSSHAKETSSPEGGDAGAVTVAPMRIDSVVLFASLSSSTAGATLSSKSMARAEGKDESTMAGRSRQGKVSSSTFALSSDDDDVVVQSSASLKAQSLPQIDRAFLSDKSGAIVGDATAMENDSTPEKELEPPASSSSAPLPPASTNPEHDDITEVKRLSTSALAPGEGQPTVCLNGAPTDNMGSESAPPPRASTVSSTRDGSARSSNDNQSAALLRNEKQPLQGDHHMGPENAEHSENTGNTLPSGSKPQSAANSGYRRLTLSPLDGDTITPPPLALLGDPEVDATAETSGNEDLGRNEDEGDITGYLDEGPILNEHDGNGFGHLEENSSLDGPDVGVGAEDTARCDHEEGVRAVEEGSLAGANSSHSGSVLDVGGGAVGNSDDDDGYF